MSSPMFEVATFNVSPKGQVAATSVVRSLMNRSAMLVLATQESRWMTGREAPLGWDWVRSWPATPVWYDAENAFVRTEGGDYWLSDEKIIEAAAAGPTMADEKWANWAAGTLRGKRIVFISVHLTPSVRVQKADELNDAQVKRLVAFVKMWKRRGYQVRAHGRLRLPAHARELQAAGRRGPDPGQKLPTQGRQMTQATG